MIEIEKLTLANNTMKE